MQGHRLSPMLRLLNVERFLSRHRRATALVGIVLVLGVAALNAHAALPEHHDHDGVGTMCVAALSIAVLAALGWRAERAAATTPCVRLAGQRRPVFSLARDTPRPRARAGPPGVLPLRR